MDMKMVDMKLSKADKKEMMPTAVSERSAPDYPWGLSLNLNADALDKLGVDEMPDAGTEVMIHAVAKITRVTSSASEKKSDRSLVAQITKMAMTPGEEPETDDEVWSRVKRDRKEA